MSSIIVLYNSLSETLYNCVRCPSANALCLRATNQTPSLNNPKSQPASSSVPTEPPCRSGSLRCRPPATGATARRRLSSKRGARSGGRLLLQDWRAAAARAANARRAVSAGRCSARTIAQCQTRIYFLKKLFKKELSKQPPSQGLVFSRLHAFLSGPTGPPRGFPPKMASVKEEEEEVGGGLVGIWKVPTRPRTGATGWGCSPPAAVVAKLAEVYERVEMERLDVERGKMEIEARKLEQAIETKVEK